MCLISISQTTDEKIYKYKLVFSLGILSLYPGSVLVLGATMRETIRFNFKIIYIKSKLAASAAPIKN